MKTIEKNVLRMVLWLKTIERACLMAKVTVMQTVTVALQAYVAILELVMDIWKVMFPYRKPIAWAAGLAMFCLVGLYVADKACDELARDSYAGSKASMLAQTPE